MVIKGLHIRDLYRLKWRFFSRKGYGIHSPFIYRLITQVIEEKKPFYAFAEIENWREEILKKKNMISLFTAEEIPPPAVGFLLFRLMYYFQCCTAIEIGSSTAIMGLYMASAQKRSVCYLLEDRVGLMNDARIYAKEKGLDNIYFVEGSYEEILKQLYIFIVRSKRNSELIFVNSLSNRMEVRTIFLLLQSFINERNILVINNIHRDKKMKQLWYEIKENFSVKTTIDLYYLGIIFFDKHLPQKNYQEYFNYSYGEKLHLYTQWR